jgi:hypothetical protein
MVWLDTKFSWESEEEGSNFLRKFGTNLELT